MDGWLVIEASGMSIVYCNGQATSKDLRVGEILGRRRVIKGQGQRSGTGPMTA